MSKGKTAPENTWQRIEYWIKRNPDKTLEECQKMLNEKLQNRKTARKDNIEYWTKKYPNKTLEECQEMLNQYKKESSFQCIEYWIKRNPDKTLEECQEMLDNAKKSYLKKRPDNSGENNPRHHSKVSQLELQRSSPFSIEFYKTKYPDKTLEECQEMQDNFINNVLSSRGPDYYSTTLAYWLKLGYDEETAKEKLSERQRTFTLEKCIEKYGEEDGIKIFEDRQKRWNKSLNKHFEIYGDGRSPQSKFAKDIINILCGFLQIEVPEKEKWIYDSDTNNNYAYDFTYKNKIIEFNGDYWHANPEKYSKDYYNKRKQKTAKEIWENDRLKKECAEKHGFEVFYVWENDWHKDSSKILKDCLEFLNKN